MTIERGYSTSSILEPIGNFAPQSAVSWAAIWAGAAVALAISLVLTLGAAGLGFALAFPTMASRGSLAAFTPALGAGAVLIQVVASAVGGYVAGRLRTTWVGTHTDETHFRDTAHGLAAWAVATLIGAVLAAMVFGPYADAMASASAAAQTVLTPEDAQRAANIAAQSSLFIAIGLLLGGLVSAAAARLGGEQHEHMHRQLRA